MRAMVLHRPSKSENSPLRLENVPIPEPKPYEVLVKVDVCGVCRTDLHILEGELPQKRKSIIPGHQIVGRIVKLGSMAKGHRIGEKVGITWINSTCGRCKFCLSGRENLCNSIKFTGYDVDGGYAEYVVADSRYIFSIPKGFDDVHAAPLFCAGIIGYRALKLSHARPGGTLALFGFGASAHIIIQVARYIGINVAVFTRSAEHQRLAKRLGAIWVGSPTSRFGGKVDASIIFAPAGELVKKALEVTEKGSTVSIADIYMSDIPSLEYQLLYNEHEIVGVTNYTREDAKEFLSYAHKIPIKTKVEVFRLEEVNKALTLLKNSKINGAAVIKI